MQNNEGRIAQTKDQQDVPQQDKIMALVEEAQICDHTGARKDIEARDDELCFGCHSY